MKGGTLNRVINNPRDQSVQRGGAKRQRDRQRHRHSEHNIEIAEHHHGQRHDRADGKIDAADENDQRHAHGHDAKHGDLIEHIEEVPHRHELVCREGEEKAEHDEPDQRTGRPTQGRKQSAGKSPSFLDCRHHQRFSSKPDRRIYTAVRINIH